MHNIYCFFYKSNFEKIFKCPEPHLFLHEHSVPGVEADDDEDDEDVARDVVQREVGGKLEQVARDAGGEVVVERLLRDVHDGVARQDELEGAALPLVTQHQQQDGDLGDVFSGRKK